jgi:hypothetical protein
MVYAEPFEVCILIERGRVEKKVWQQRKKMKNQQQYRR